MTVVETRPEHDERRRRRVAYAGIAVALAVLVVVTVMLVRGMPPRTVRMATGEAAGAYHAYGERYRAFLAKHGVKLELVETRGAQDNLERLRDARAGIGVALLQNGLTSERDAPGIVSLGTVAYEPVWVFYRGERKGGVASQDWLAGKRISIGPAGSGTHKLAREIVELLGLDSGTVQPLDLPTDAGVDAILRGEIDLLVIVDPFAAPAVQRLLAAPGVNLVSFVRADAHVALRPYLNKLTLPQGVIDLRRNVPSQDVTLVAPKTSLTVREDLHPAIQYLLLQAASEVNAKPDLFTRPAQFPAPEPIDLPLSEPALQYYKSGSPFLQRYLPFWVAALVSELLRVLIPLVAVVYPLLRLAPGIYGWGMRRRIFRPYGELKFIEMQLEARDSKASVDDLRLEIERLEMRANHMRTPSAFAHMLYTLRLHISMVRQRLEKR
jgi:TRAP-type uncharacterized transport system substrate-binding protein